MKNIKNLKRFLIIPAFLVLLLLLRGPYCLSAACSIIDGFWAWIEQLKSDDLLTPFISVAVCAASITASTLITIRSDFKVRKREFERELRESFLLFYDPLVALLRPLRSYLGSSDVSTIDLKAYDPTLSSHRRKLTSAAAFARGIERAYQSGKSSLSATKPELSRDLSLLRLWVFAIGYLSENGEVLGGEIPSDSEVLEAIGRIENLVVEERTKLRWS